MQTYLTSFVVAALAGSALTPVARLLSFRWGAVSSPGGRHIHGQAIARLGGLGIFAAFMTTVISLVATGFANSVLEPEQLRLGLGLLIGGSVMFAVGLYDDLKTLRALYKLYGQILAAAIAWHFGFRVDVVDLPMLPSFETGILSLPLTIIWIVGIINAVNLIDGLDGLAAGVVFFAAVTNFVVAWMMGTTLVAMVMATLAGAVLGFLFFNFNPARIFMGDSGSYFLGFILAACSIAGPLQKASAAVSIAVPLVALGVPIIDTLLAIVRRFLEKRPLFSPDRGHIHHRLLDMGITHRRAVLIIYGVTVLLCISSIAIAFGRQWQVGAAILGVSAVLFGLIRFIGYFEYLMVLGRQKQRMRSRHVEWLRKLVLKVPAKWGAETTHDTLLEQLGWLAREAKLDSIEVRHKGELIKRFAGNDYQDMSDRDVTFASFPFFGEAGDVRFGWKSEYGDVPPQMDILLQLVVDQLEEHLRRVGSSWVPAAHDSVLAAEADPEPSLKPARS
ncbi:MAG: MraY family glycosyltransferase [Archangium sp.]|nr:MraY family glycosyltransferase [Archangium sp.]MDP3575824.1 MraY family glycosyltransferase [Archangium sp.]